MSDEPDPPDAGKVARLHPPRLPHQASLDRSIQAQIGSQLRTMYEHYVDQPIPDRLVELVRRLGAAQPSAGTDGPGTAPDGAGRGGAA